MATQVQIRRGTSSQVAAFTGAEGEIVVNTTNDSLHIHDGSSAGGFEMARADLNNVSDTDLNAALTGNTVSALTVTALTSSGIEISGAVTATASDTNPAIFASTSGSNFTDLFLRHASSSFTNAVRLRAVSDGLAIFTSDVQERIRVLSTGLVGIGTSSPDTLLELVGADPILTIRDSSTSSSDGNATLRLAETGASDTLDQYFDIKATAGQLQIIDNWNEGGGTGTRVVIDDSGRVGLGVNDPDAVLDISSGTNELGLLRVTQRLSGAPAYGLDVGLDPTLGDPVFSRIVNDTVTESFRINRSNGALISSGGITLGTSSGAYNSAKTLDDYEEGTFTLTISSASFTIASQTNTYTKIGNTVSIRGRVVFSAVLSNGSSVVFTGGPFVCNTSIHGVGVARETTTSGDIFTAQMSAGSSTLSLSSMDGIAVGSNQVFLANKNYDYQITYQV